MIDGLGRPQSALVIGGTSEIGLAICRELACWNPSIAITLAGRSVEALRSASTSLSDDFESVSIRIAQLNLENVEASIATVEHLWKQYEFDLVLLTAGVLPKSEAANSQPRTAVSAAMVNFVGQLAIGTYALQCFDNRGSGYLIAISSVAAERIRVDNYVYGSTKSGLDGWALGAARARQGSQVRILVVRPGMVRTRMSAGMKERPLIINPESVARTIRKHLRDGPSLVWSPFAMRYLMMMLKMLPSRMFDALSNRDRSPDRNVAS